MHIYTAVVECCSDTGFYVGYVPGFPGAHSQGETIEELSENLKEVTAMLLGTSATPQLHLFPRHATGGSGLACTLR